MPQNMVSQASKSIRQIEFKGKNITLSNYVSSVKQRGEMKSSGSRNVKRFMLSGTEGDNRNNATF